MKNKETYLIKIPTNNITEIDDAEYKWVKNNPNTGEDELGRDVTFIIKLEKDLYTEKGKTKATLERMEPSITMNLP